MTFRTYLLALVVTNIFTLTVAQATPAQQTINWAGCGITKKAFMQELAIEYEKRTG